MSDSLDCMTMIFGLSSTFFMFIFMIVSFVQLSDIRNRIVAIEHNVDLVERMLRSLKDTVKTVPHHPTTAPRAPQKVPTPQRTAPESPERPPIQSPTTATADTLPAEPSALPNASPKTTEATDAPASQTTPSSHTPQTPVEGPSKPPQAEPTDVPTTEATPAPTSALENTTEINTAEPSVEPPQQEPTSPSLSPDRTTQTNTPPPPNPAPESPPSARPRGASSVLERGIGGTAAVWVGAAALALAGALLVQYSIEQELISARARVGAAAGSGILLLMLGEWLTHRIRLVGGGLLAAGVAVLYSAFVAATMIYPILNPWLGASLMVATTATAATMAIRHDMLIIAVLGLLGGFVTPIVSGIQPDNPILFFGYLLLLNIGVIVVAWKRSWPILTYLALLLSFTTELGWTSTTSTTPTAPYLIMVALLTGPFAVAGHMGLTRPKRDTDTPHNSSTWLLISASLTMPIMIGLLSGVRWAHSPFLWVQQGLLATLMFVMAALNERYRPLPWVAWLLLATQQVAWLFDAPDGAHLAWVAGSAMLLFGLGSSFLALRQPQRIGEPTA
ncbi:MAG: DUF2339 domain-containing protein [Myxococcota bacterium]